MQRERFHLLTVNASPLFDVVYGGFTGLFLCITLLSRYARARFALRENSDFEMRAVVAKKVHLWTI